MVGTYEIAIDNDALSKEGRFASLFHTMVKQADECYLFISEYRSRRYFGETYYLLPWCSVLNFTS